MEYLSRYLDRKVVKILTLKKSFKTGSTHFKFSFITRNLTKKSPSIQTTSGIYMQIIICQIETSEHIKTSNHGRLFESECYLENLIQTNS